MDIRRLPSVSRQLHIRVLQDVILEIHNGAFPTHKKKCVTVIKHTHFVWGDFKTAVGEAVVKELEPIQARYNELIKDKAYLEKCYSEAAPRAEAIARRTLQKVMKKVGYLPVAH